MKKNVFVFPCGSEIGLDIYSSVSLSTYFHLIGGNSVDDHGRFVYEDYISGIPFITDGTFLERIKQIIKEREISVIYPTMDLAITILKKNEQELGIPVIGSPVFTTEICLSKRKTYQYFRDFILCPKIFDYEMVKDFPVFVKPEIGYGAKGASIINNREELDYFYHKDTSIVTMEYLPGEEYTIDCFTDRNRRLLYSKARTRNRIKNGVSVNSSFVAEQAEFVYFAETINKKLEFRGSWFVQVKRNFQGQLCLLEVASRLGGSSLLSRALGCNLALLSLFDILGKDVKILTNSYDVEIDRALSSKYRISLDYKVVYVDFDDCLILENSFINIELVRFLFKCINNNKKLVLLSKHQGNLVNELERFRLTHIFDQIIQLDLAQQKSDYIDEVESIFIDDSFAERDAVHLKKGIPVFGPEMVDVL